MKETKTPLVQALLAHLRKGSVSFHTPGHKGCLEGLGMLPFPGSDLTELPGLDDLHHPEGAILEAQALAAEAFGSDHTFFLVNGSTVGNQAMILAACPPGAKIILPRNAHQSVLAGLILAGAVPVYLEPVWDSDLGIAHGLRPEDVSEALRRHPDACAVLLLHPTYWGFVSDLEIIASIVHGAGKLLLVDEAHGAHFGFHPELPVSALSAGADLAVQSIHKTLGSLTQSSMLHLRGRRISLERVQSVLRLLQSSSPSYLLMASLDLARRQMVEEGPQRLQRLFDFLCSARAEIEKIPGLSVHPFRVSPGCFAQDFSKLIVQVGGIGIGGDEALDFLQARGVDLELASPTAVLALCSIGNEWSDFRQLLTGLRELRKNPAPPKRPILLSPPALPELSLSPREAFFAPSQELPLPSCVGRICSEAVTPYPPGIPVLAPGERITREVVDYLSLFPESEFAGKVRVVA